MQVVSWLSFQYKHNVIHQFHSSEEVKYNFLSSTAWVSSLIKSSFLHDDCSFLKHTFHPLTPTLVKFQYNLVPSPSSLPIFPVLPILYISLTSSFPPIKELFTPHSLKLKTETHTPLIPHPHQIRLPFPHPCCLLFAHVSNFSCPKFFPKLSLS